MSRAPGLARAAAATWWAMSSIVTWSVSSWPSTTMASVSPTRIMSTPAPSATRADGKSYAVTITNGGPLPLRALMSGARSGARESGLDDAVVISEPPPSGAPTAPGSTASVASREGRRLRRPPPRRRQLCRPSPQSPSHARATGESEPELATATGREMTERACENCAFPDEELVLVRRVCVTPETWERPASRQVVEEPELWCVSCRSQYPHEVVEDDDEA